MPLMYRSRNNSFIPSQPGFGQNLRSAWNNLRHSPIFRLGVGYFAACFISLLVFTLLATRLYNQQSETMIHEYGNTVAQQLAQSCVDAVVRSDLVSLHAQLEKLAEMNSVVDIAVYDMENHVLAQASTTADKKNRIPEATIRNFPASITFQDSIAGKVIVRLDTQNIVKQKNWLYAYLVCGLLIAFGLVAAISHFWIKRAKALYKELTGNLNTTLSATSTLSALEQELPAWSEIVGKLKHLNDHIHYIEQRHLEQRSPAYKFTQSGKFTYKPTEGSYAELMIACSNLAQLQQQVHHRELQRLLDNFQQALTNVSKLYHGVNVHSPGDHVLLRFLVNEVSDASLQAICCAVLLKGLLKTNLPETMTGITLEFRFAVHWHAHDERGVADLLHNHLLQGEYQEMLQLCQQAKAGEILTTKGIKQSPAVAEHVKLDLISGDSDVDYYRVHRISDSYKKLLEQQIQQLVSIA